MGIDHLARRAAMSSLPLGESPTNQDLLAAPEECSQGEQPWTEHMKRAPGLAACWMGLVLRWEVKSKDLFPQRK